MVPTATAGVPTSRWPFSVPAIVAMPESGGIRSAAPGTRAKSSGMGARALSTKPTLEMGSETTRPVSL